MKVGAKIIEKPETLVGSTCQEPCRAGHVFVHDSGPKAASSLGDVAFFMPVETPDAILVWNPKKGYSCSVCSWTRRVHIQNRLPEDDELAEAVRKEFDDHIREKHPQKYGTSNTC